MAVDTNPAEAGGGDVADVVVTDRELFDSALAPEPADLGGNEPELPVVDEQPQQTPAQRARDEHGRFAPQQAQAPRQQPQVQPPPSPEQPKEQPHQVPLRTYLDEREARYRAQAEADQVKAQWDRLQQEAEQQRIAQMRQQMPQTIYDNPEQYLIHNVINPLRQEGHMMMLQIKDGMSRETANHQFGTQNVEAALQAMAQIRQTPQGDFIFRQIMSNGHPYGALVQWHHNVRQTQQVRQRIAEDPDGKKQREQLLNDPAFRAEAIRREQAQRQQQRGGPPNVQLPPSLSSLPSSSGRGSEIGDMSDESLFRQAIS